MRNEYEEIKNAIMNMSDFDVISLHNVYCDKIDGAECIIYSMDDFNEIMTNIEPWEIARACFYGKRFCPVDNYFYFDAYGNLESMDYVSCEEGPIYIDQIVKYIIDNSDCLGNMEIADILDC